MSFPARVPNLVIGLFALLGFALLAGGPYNAPSAQAASTTNQLAYFVDGPEESGLVNYDFNSEYGSNNNVDWPITLVFFNGATVNNVKDALSNYYGQFSTESKHTSVVYYGGLSHWDSDTGKKGISCPLPGQWTRHYRIYGGYSDTIYSQNLGNWVAATTHKDANECPPPATNKVFFDTEEVEEHIAGLFSNAGYSVYNDFQSWGNWEPYRPENNHIWDSDGLATYIDVACTICRGPLP